MLCMHSSCNRIDRFSWFSFCIVSIKLIRLVQKSTVGKLVAATRTKTSKTVVKCAAQAPCTKYIGKIARNGRDRGLTEMEGMGKWDELKHGSGLERRETEAA